MDTMYPGTTPWERLGSSGGGAPSAGAGVQSAGASAKLQAETSKEVAHINANASMSNAETLAGTSRGGIKQVAKTAKAGQDIQRDVATAQITSLSAGAESSLKSALKSAADAALSGERLVGVKSDNILKALRADKGSELLAKELFFFSCPDR